MKNSKVTYIAIIGFSILLLLICSLLFTCNKRLAESQLFAAQKVSENARLIEFVNNLIPSSLRVNEAIIDKNVTLYNLSGTELSLTQLNIERPNIIFSYTILQCDVCIDAIIESLKKVEHVIGKNRIAILASYEKKREAALFLSNHNIAIPFYLINFQNLLNVQIDDPFLFVLDRDNIARYIFVPHEGFTEITKIYFKEVLMSFFGIAEDRFENAWN